MLQRPCVRPMLTLCSADLLDENLPLLGLDPADVAVIVLDQDNVTLDVNLGTSNLLAGVAHPENTLTLHFLSPPFFNSQRAAVSQPRIERSILKD